jgi:hypothetical protein
LREEVRNEEGLEDEGGKARQRHTSTRSRVQYGSGAIEQKLGVARVVDASAAIFEHQAHELDGALAWTRCGSCSRVRGELGVRTESGAGQELARAIEKTLGGFALCVTVSTAVSASAKVVTAPVRVVVCGCAMAADATTGYRSVRRWTYQREL